MHDPREGYLPGSAALADAFGLKETWPTSTRGGIAGVPRDNDVDYTILALRVLERLGLEFTPERVTETLLLSLPYLRVFTAERVTYHNLISGRSSSWPSSRADRHRLDDRSLSGSPCAVG